MFKNESDFKKLVDRLDIDTEPNVTHRKNLRREMLSAFSQRRSELAPVSPAGAWQTVTRTIRKSKIARLAAAVIIVALAVGLIHWLPGGKGEVKIPSELANMPIEELLEIHFGKAESPCESSMVAAAVAKALEKLSAREILAIGQKYGKKDGLFACWAGEDPLSLPLAVEVSDFIVRAHVDDVTLDVSDLKEAIRMPSSAKISAWVGHVKATIDLHVLEVYPSLPAQFEDKISFLTVVTTEELDIFEKSKEYLIGLRQYGDIIWWISRPKVNMEKFVCPIDPSSGIVSGLKYGSMSLDEAWEFILDTYDAIHEGKLPSREVLDYWLAKLRSDDLTDCWSAVDYFGTLREPIVPQELVAGLVERHLDTLGQNCRAIIAHEESLEQKHRGEQWQKVSRALLNDAYQETSFLTDALDLLIDVADKSSVDRILAFYEKDAPSPQSIFNWEEDYGGAPKPLIPRIIRLALKHPVPKRRERFLRLLSCQPLPKLLSYSILTEELGKTDGEDIDQLLVDMLKDPAAYGIPDTDSLQCIWYKLAEKSHPYIGEYLELFLADPENSNLGVRHSNTLQGRINHAREALSVFHANQTQQMMQTMPRKEAIQHLVDLNRSGKISTQPALVLISDLLESNDTESIPFLCETLPDHHHLNLIRQIIEVLPDPSFINMLRSELEKEVTGELLSALFACGAQDEAVEMGMAETEKLISGEMNFWQCSSLISFLGTTGNESVLPTIEYFVHEDVMETYREEERLLQNAVLALGRLRAKSTIPRLKELYESKDVDISVKIAAALSLYCLGDDRGVELLEHFVNGTERSIPEVQWKSADKIFQVPIVYLESTRTDELLLESFRSSHFRPTLYYHIAGKYIDHRTYAFARVYQTDLLPVLVEQLNNRDRVTRKYVNTMLKRLTGQDFGFRPDKFVFQQTEAIEQWRSYVEQYLVQTTQPAE